MLTHTPHTLNTTEAGLPLGPASRRTVDAFLRAWHGLMALSFAGAYLTADMERWRLVHVVLGYTAAGLWLVRLVWGFVGPRSARWSALWGKLRGIPAWLASAQAGQPQWRQGQHLLLAFSVVGVLWGLVPVVLSGYATYMGLAGEWLEEVHEWLGNLMLATVLVHVGGVLLLSLLQKRNLAAPMLTGRTPGRGPDLVQHNRAGLAAVLVVLVLAFWWGQWRDAQTRKAAPDAPVGWLHPSAERTQSQDEDED